MQPIGPYEVSGELGRGGMGVVLRGRGPDGGAVAIKLLLRHRPGAAERFAREVRLLRELSAEPGFVPILDAGQGRQGPWLAMPLLEGGTLRDRLRGGPLGVEQAVALGRSVARAVGLAHARGVVHRDLKPENVLFSASGQPLVADLGLAKHFSEDGPGAGLSVDLTRTGELKGTLGYMAPEQINDARSVGPASDVFALGAILYELLCGEAPFAAESAHEGLARVVTGDFVPIRQRRRDVPPWLAGVVDRALRPKAADRWPDGAALAAALAAPTPVEGRRSPLALIGVTGLVAALAAVGWVARSTGVSREPETIATPTSTGGTSPPSGTEARPEGGVPSVPAASKLRATGGLRLQGVWGSRAGALRDEARGVRFGADGLLLAGDTAGRLVAFDRRDGSFVRLVGALPAPLVALDVSPDGRLAAACDVAGALAVWTVATGEQVWRLDQPAGDVAALAFSPDGGLLTWTAPGRGIKAAELSTGVTKIVDAERGGAAIAYGPKGDEALVVGEAVLFVDTWNDLVREAGRGSGAVGAAYPRRGPFALALEADGRVSRWRVDGRRPAGDFGRAPAPGGASRATRLAISGDGLTAVTGAADGWVTVWGVERGELRAELALPAPVQGVALSLDGRQVAVAGGDRRVRLYDVEARELRPVWGATGLQWVTSITPRPDGALVVSGIDGVERWEPSTGARAALFVDHRGPVNDVALAPPAGLLALSVAHDRTARVWAPTTGRELAELPVSRNNVLCCATSPDGKLGLVGTDDPFVILVDLSSLSEVRRLEGEGLHWVRRVAFDPTGRTALAADHGGRVHLWEVATGRALAWFSPGRQKVGQPAAPAWFDAREGVERVLVASGPDVGLWDLREGMAQRREELTLRGFAVSRALLLPDRRRALLLGGEEVRLVDVVGKAELGRLDLAPLGDLPWCATLAADGRSAWIGSHAGLVVRVAVGE